MIECQNISLQAGEFKLKDMSLRVESGQYAVVMGKTGIGKTTILEAVCGLRKIQRGKCSLMALRLRVGHLGIAI